MDRDQKRVIVIGLATTAAIGAAELLRNGPTRKRKVAESAKDAVLSAGVFSIDPEWDLPVTRNDRVDFFIEFLIGKRHDDFRTWMERLGRYGPMIQTELRERGMPEDLIYLAMIESGFEPDAYSSADAAGVWQFIAPTARRYGLEVSRYVDERRDPVKATRAALDYLEDLYDQFGSWYLAAAAYNTGENRVERVLQEQVGGARGDESLYWKISSHIPRETRDYVPLMLAAGHIAKHPGKYGFENLQYQEPLSFEQVEVPGGTRLSDVAEAAGVETDVVRTLNPALVQNTTPPDRSWRVRIPVDRAEEFAANFQNALRAG